MSSKLYITVLLSAACILLATPSLMFAGGKAMYNHKKYSSSANIIKKALFFKPKNPDYRYYYVKSLAELKPTYEVQKEMFSVTQKGLDDGATVLAKEKMREWKANINHNIGSNYIEYVPADSSVLRWNRSSFPLKVYIDEKGLKDLPEYYQSNINQALKQWEEAVDFVKFKQVNKKSHAQIIINIEKLSANTCNSGGCSYVVGFTSPAISGRNLKNMTITLYDKTSAGDYFTDKEIYNTVLHELGHALGIMGHSYNSDDLMHQQAKEQTSVYSHFRSDFQYLTANDKNTLKLLYMLEPDITDRAESSKKGLIYTPIILGSPEEIVSKKLEEALDYINSYPKISIGYINLAGAYAELKEYNKAIASLNKALEVTNTNDELYIIYYNFALIYLNTKKYDNALKYAQLAKGLKSDQEILELLGVIENKINKKK